MTGDATDPDWSNLAKKVGSTSWLFGLTGLGTAIAVVLPLMLLLLPVLLVVIASAYVWRVSPHEPEQDDQIQARGKGAMLAWRLLLVSVLVTVLVSALGLIGGGAFAAGLILLMVGVLALSGAWPLVFGTLDAAGVPRFLHDGHPLRYVLRFLGLERLMLRADGSPELPRLYLATLVALSFALLSQVAGAATAQSVVSGIFPQSRPVFEILAARPSESASASPAPSEMPGESAIEAIPSNTPTELTLSPCPPERQVLAMMSTGVPTKVGKALFVAWRVFGGAVVGCPDSPPSQVGSLWVQPLSNGHDAPSEIVYGEGHAAAVLSDLYNVTVNELPSVVWVESRRRWGLGTLQLLHMRNGSCQLAQRYEQDGSTLLSPSAVTAAVITVGHTFGAVPWVRSQQPIPGGYSFEVHFIAPGDAVSPYRDLRTVIFRYTGGVVYRTDTEVRVASRQDGCPTVAENLSATADQVEKTVQVGHG